MLASSPVLLRSNRELEINKVDRGENFDRWNRNQITIITSLRYYIDILWIVSSIRTNYALVN
jgi:hypothetical protein